MQVFEFYFNPKKAPQDRIFDSFCYEPENIYEKKLGSLFMVGELRNVLPQNLKFLQNLAILLKRKYYSAPIRFSPEASLKESLRKSNEFFEEIAKSGDVSWLGNLNLAVISLTPRQKPWWGTELNLTKVGDLKIFLLREGQIIDIEQKLKFEEIEPYPLKIFGNIVSGKLAENDIILALTEEVFEFFKNQDLLNELSKITPFNQKKLNELFNKRKEELLKISGICLLISLSKDYQPRTTLVLKEGLVKEFSFKKVFNPIIKFLKRVSRLRPKVKFPKIRISKIKISPTLKKNLILILVLIILLTIGFFIFKGEKEEHLKLAKKDLEEIIAKKNQAENFLIFKKEQQANILFQEAWNKILPQTKIGAPLREEALLLKKSIEENLFPLNKIKKIEDPEILFEFKPEEINLIPQKMLVFNSTLYFYNPFSSNLYQFELPKGGVLLKTNGNLKLGTVLSDSILFFSNPNILIQLFPQKGLDGSFQEKTIQLPSPDFSFDKLSSLKSSIYFLDTQSGEIVKYSEPKSKEVVSSQFWLNPKTKKPLGAKSMTIDGSFWILTKNNEIERYYAGFYKEALLLNFFPYLENPTKIWTTSNLPYLYLLEPGQNRLIILIKGGEIVKQFQSEKFDNLLDFSVSQDGKTIYLLNGLKVYRLSLSSD